MRLLAAALASALVAATPPAAEELSQITLTMDVFDVVRPPKLEPGLGFLSGKALAHEGELELFDVMFVIDTSGSTAESSGLGKRSGWLSGVPGASVARSDSVLGAEVAAIESLLDGFDPRTTRVGLVSFAGSENPRETHAWVEQPLTANYAEMRQALADRLLVDPEGGTDLRAGLLRGAIELLGTHSAQSAPRKRAVKHLVVLTDGMPTLPEYNAVDGAIHSAESLAKRGIRVHVFAIGREADHAGREIEPVAQVTHGEYHAVHDLSKLAQLIGAIHFKSLRDVRVQNKTTGSPALQLEHDDKDGSWSALVSFVPGKNLIEVIAVAADGREKRVEKEVTFGDVLLAPEQLARRDRLLALSAEQEAGAKPAAAKKKSKELTIQPDPAKPPAH